jgi:hypothetical protein
MLATVIGRTDSVPLAFAANLWIRAKHPEPEAFGDQNPMHL